MDLKEQIIVEQLKKGDERAYKYVYDHYYPLLCKYAYAFLYDQYLSEAIVNDTIFHIYEIRDSLTITSSLKSYLLTAIRNRCLNYKKLNYNNKEFSFSNHPNIDLLDNRLSLNAETPLRVLLDNELETKLLNAINKLPQNRGRVFKLSRFEGMTYQEISDKLKISTNTIKYHIGKALEELSKALIE